MNIKKMKNWNKAKDELINLFGIRKKEKAFINLDFYYVYLKVFRTSETSISLRSSFLAVHYDLENDIIRYVPRPNKGLGNTRFTVEDLIELERTLRYWRNTYLIEELI